MDAVRFLVEECGVEVDARRRVRATRVCEWPRLRTLLRTAARAAMLALCGGRLAGKWRGVLVLDHSLGERGARVVKGSVPQMLCRRLWPRPRLLLMLV